MTNRLEAIEARLADAIPCLVPREGSSLLTSHEPMVGVCHCDLAWAVARIRELENLLTWLDRKGGLGLDVHDKITDALALRVDAGEMK